MTSQSGEMLVTGKRAGHQPTPWGLFQVFLPYPEPLSVTLAAKPEISSRYHGEVGVGLQAERRLWTGRLMEVAACTYSWMIRKRRRKGLGMHVACKEEMQEVKKGSRPAEVAAYWVPFTAAVYRVVTSIDTKTKRFQFKILNNIFLPLNYKALHTIVHLVASTGAGSRIFK